MGQLQFLKNSVIHIKYMSYLGLKKIFVLVNVNGTMVRGRNNDEMIRLGVQTMLLGSSAELANVELADALTIRPPS